MFMNPTTKFLKKKFVSLFYYRSSTYVQEVSCQENDKFAKEQSLQKYLLIIGKNTHQAHA